MCTFFVSFYIVSSAVDITLVNSIFNWKQKAVLVHAVDWIALTCHWVMNVLVAAGENSITERNISVALHIFGQYWLWISNALTRMHFSTTSLWVHYINLNSGQRNADLQTLLLWTLLFIRLKPPRFQMAGLLSSTMYFSFWMDKSLWAYLSLPGCPQCYCVLVEANLFSRGVRQASRRALHLDH